MKKYPMLRFMQKNIFHVSNSDQPKLAPGKKVLDDGRVYCNDIRYGEEYPNSFLDIYYSPVEAERHPTLFYIHGGGYSWGTKEDYFADSSDRGMGVFFSGVSKLGYNIVSVNYAFLPEHLYPTPIRQVSQAINFLKSANDLKIDMEHVAFGGDSAGAQIAGQFINIQINPSYAQEMGIAPVLPKEAIIALTSFSGLLDPERFGVTHHPIIDILFAKCGCAYYQTKELLGNADCRQSSVIAYATADFPPSFISDGNNGTFYDQASDFSKRLTELGVKNELVLYPSSEAILGHGYETADSPQAKATKQRAIRFLQELM